MSTESWKRPDATPKCTFAVTNAATTCPHHTEIYTPRPKIADTVLDIIGHTPLVRLNRIPQSEGIECEVLAKCEFLNPGGSIKDRIGRRMVLEGARTGLYKKGDILIEPTSGNTGIGLAMAAAVKGYKCVITLPEKMSQEKCRILRLLGAELIRTRRGADYLDADSHIRTAADLKARLGDSAHIPDQYTNVYNPMAHYDSTGPEILEACAEGEPDGRPRLDMIVFGAGTGGTATGIGKLFKQKLPQCKTVCVDPHGSNLADYHLGKEAGDPKPYEVEGIGYEFTPTVVDRKVLDTWYRVGDKEGLLMARRLITEEGLLVGGSSGTALVAALKAIKDAGLGKGHRVVVILPDSVRNYMTKFISDEWMFAHNFMSFHKSDAFTKPWFSVKIDEMIELTKLVSSVVLDETTVVKEAIAKTSGKRALVKKGSTVIAVFNSEQALTRLLNGVCKPTDPVLMASDKEFKSVTFDDPVEKMARLLAYFPHVVVQANQPGGGKDAYVIDSTIMLNFSMQFNEEE